MKNYILFLLFTFIINACDPPRFCNEPNCLYTDVGTEIKAVMSGNLDSIIKIGDTIRLQMNLPETLATNFGNLIFGTLYKKSFFGLQSYSFDSVSKDYTFKGFSEFDEILLKYGQGNTTTDYWQTQSREYESLFIPKIKGKYIIELTGGRIEMQERNGKEWAINFAISLGNIDRHLELNKSWFPIKYQEQEYQKSLLSKGFYCFEVK